MKNAKIVFPMEKMIFAFLSGVPDVIRTHGLPLRSKGLKQ